MININYGFYDKVGCRSKIKNKNLFIDFLEIFKIYVWKI